MITLRFVFFLSLLLPISLASAKIITPLQKVNNPLCVVDVGRVLVDQNQFANIPAYLGLIRESNNKITLIKAFFWCMYNFSKLRTMNLQGPEDSVIDYIAQNYPVLYETTKSNTILADQIKEILCSATPIRETQKIVANLIDARCPVALGSNKGKKTLAHMIKSGALADLDYALIFTCDAHEKADMGIFYKKPNLRYYELLKEHLHQKGFVDNTCIFIDNDLANVEAACKVGMIGILYTTPEELIADLHQLGIKF